MRTYYTHDTTHYPLSALWSDLSPMPPIGRVFGFIHLAIRRVFGFHLPAAYGESDANPEWIPNPADLPRDILDAAQQQLSDAGESGFTLLHAAHCDTIGSKRIFWLYLVNGASTAFMRIQVASYDNAPTTELRWSAHSYRADGTGIHTLPMVDDAFNLKSPPGQEYHAVPIDTAVANLLEAHGKTIQAERSLSMTTETTVRESCNRSAQLYIQQMITSGYYRQLNAEEIVRITINCTGIAVGAGFLQL